MVSKRRRRGGKQGGKRDDEAGAVAGEVEARLARKLERVLRQGHPWVWREALVDFSAAAGSVVVVVDSKGRMVARGIADDGPIGVRVWTTDPRQRIDAELVRRRIACAGALREQMLPPQTDCYRLLHGEGDRVPGVVCDVYGRCAVLRFDGGGAAAWRDAVVAGLEPVLATRGVDSLLLRSGRGPDSSTELIHGDLPSAPLEVRERGMRLWVDVVRGQKTGAFLDHRPSRMRVRGLARGLEVLNLYGYTGAFSVAAGLGAAAAVETVDLATPALALADRSWASNDLDPGRHRSHASDVRAFLDDAATRGARWDLIIADPPSFAPREAAVEAALTSYRKLHASCMSLLRPGGFYLAASCSSHVRHDAFDETLRDAARKLRRPFQLLDRWSAGFDHPRLPAFVEGHYLDAVLLRV